MTKIILMNLIIFLYLSFILYIFVFIHTSMRISYCGMQPHSPIYSLHHSPPGCCIQPHNGLLCLPLRCKCLRHRPPLQIRPSVESNIFRLLHILYWLEFVNYLLRATLFCSASSGTSNLSNLAFDSFAKKTIRTEIKNNFMNILYD